MEQISTNLHEEQYAIYSEGGCNVFVLMGKCSTMKANNFVVDQSRSYETYCQCEDIALSLLSNCSLLLNPHIRSRFIWAPKLPSVSCLEPVWLSTFCSSLDLASNYILN
uniref:Putative ovule protein n=1 Tax=Solanum chacoense TaxID=4108 RepID=A0A0V0ITZ9_SOLCH